MILTSSSIPIDIKKRLVKRSRKGMTVLSAWWLYSERDIIRPARNAPRDSERPILEVSQATAKQMRMILIRNISGLRILAIWKSTFGIIYCEATYVKPIIPPPFSKRNNISRPISPLPPASIGMRSIIGTTIISWKMRIASDVRACGVLIPSPCWNIFNTMAVLLRLIRKPIKMP
jgi:hypothetical protein